MDWETNDSILAFGKFKQKCELMFKSILKDADGEEQVSYILLWVGEQGLDIYNSWSFVDEEGKDPKKILNRFMEHLEPRTNHRIHRYTLQGMRQEQGESVDNFVAKIKNIGTKCKFSGNEELEDRLLDQLIWGTNDPEVQKSLIGRAKKLTLNAAIDIARSYEATKRQMNSLSSQNMGNPQRVNTINRKKIHDDKEISNALKCTKCGKIHKLPHKGNCPAHGTKCRNCGKMNHWQKVCKSGKGQCRSKSPQGRNRLIIWRNKIRKIYMQIFQQLALSK